MIGRAFGLVKRLLGMDPRMTRGGALDLDFNFIKQFDWGHGATIEDYLLLMGVVANVKPETILEIGTSHGLGCLLMAHAAANTGVDVRVTTVDLDQSGSRKNLGGFPELEKRIDFIESASDEALAKFAREGRRFDFIFVDGAHDYAQARKDWEAARAISDVFALHDSTQFLGVQRLVAEIRQSGEFETFQFLSRPGHLRYSISNALKVQGGVARARIITGLTLVQRRARLDGLERMAHYDEHSKLITGHEPSIHPDL